MVFQSPDRVVVRFTWRPVGETPGFAGDPTPPPRRLVVIGRGGVLIPAQPEAVIARRGETADDELVLLGGGDRRQVPGVAGIRGRRCRCLRGIPRQTPRHTDR